MDGLNEKEHQPVSLVQPSSETRVVSSTVSEDNISVLQSYQCSINVIKLNLAVTMPIDKRKIAFEEVV